MNRPSDNLFIEFWQDKYKQFREDVWDKFNNKHSVPKGRWETAIAIMPNDTNAERYKYLSGVLTTEDRLLSELGRNFRGSTFKDYSSSTDFTLKERFTKEEIEGYYAELCEIEFPKESFRNPTIFDYNNDLKFDEYTLALTERAYAKALIYEHIVFPYDYVTSYPIPLFQPQASLYFLTRIRGPLKYANNNMPHELTTEERILLHGANHSGGINSFLKEFLISAEFREWERSVSAELSVLRFRAFFKDLSHFLTIDPNNWFGALEQSLPTLIRGDISSCNEACSNGSSHINIDLRNIIDKANFHINTETESGWNKINEARRPLLEQYKTFVPEVVGILKGISENEAKAKANEMQARMMELLEEPFHILTEALNTTRENTQELHAILFAPQQGIFAAQQNIAKLFKDRSVNNPNNTVTSIYHKPDDYSKNKAEEDAQWVLAHALARFSGRELKDYKTADSALEGEVNFLITAAKDNNNSLHDYSKAVFHLLGEEIAMAAVNFKQFPVRYLNNIKSRLFTPFKPDEAEKPIKWPILYALIPKLQLISAKMDSDNIEQNNLNATAILAAKANPLVTQGHLLDFICGVVEANETERLNATLILTGSNRNNPTSVKLIIEADATKPWIKDDEKENFLNKLKNFIAIRRMNGRLQGEYGDFHRPFAVLLERCLRDVLPQDIEDTISLIWPNLTISFEGNKFNIFSTRGE